ncbi:MAG: phosphate/phosphonate ABC transporter permease [Pseudomonadota bacterium]
MSAVTSAPNSTQQPPLFAVKDHSARDAVFAFELKRAAHLRRDAIVTALGLTIGLGLIFWAFQASGFSANSFGQDALGKAWQFIARMDPELEANSLFEDRSTRGSLAHWFGRWPQWRVALIETIEMAVVATALSAFFGLLAGLASARTAMPYLWVRVVTKRTLEVIRTFPDLILAILLVSLFGLGPLAGLLTLTISGSASLGRFFGEVLENVDKRPRDAMRAAGAGPLQQIRFGIIPQISPVLTSMTFLRFETCIASATTLGIVGAGGIGQELNRALTFNQIESYLAILILIVGLIVIADLASGLLRQRLSLERMAR